MNLEDIEIGNWLQILECGGVYEKCRVVNTNHNSCEVVTLRNDKVNFDTPDKIEQLSGISINEAILEKLGFIKDGEVYKFFYRATGDILNDIIAQKENGIWTFSKDGAISNNIRYLHTLQNLLTDFENISFDGLFSI